MPDPGVPVPTPITVPIFGFGIGTRSPNLSAQMRENLYVEKPEEPDKSALALFSRPGLTRFAQAQGRITGIVVDVIMPPVYLGEWVLFATEGVDHLTLVNGAGTVYNSSTILSVDGATISGYPTRSANDGTKAVWRDGVRGYVTDLSDSVFSTIVLDTTFYPNAVAFPATCNSITYCASRFVCDDPAFPGRFRWSAAGDGTSWAALDFATAESNPDALTSVFEANGQLILFGTQTLEFWAPAAAGASGQLPFVRVGGANIQWGTNAIDTIRKCNDSVIFVGRNQGGNRQVVQIKGYQAQVVSTPDIEYDIQNDPGADAASAMFYVANGHPFYILNLATHSWAYDLRTGAWQKFTTDGSRYAGQWEAAAFGQIIVTDYRDGRIYKVDPDAYTDDGNIMVREVTSKHASANLMRLSCREIAIDCETGVGAADGGAPPGKALSFDGVTTYVNVPDVAAHQIGIPLTIEAMVTLNRNTTVASDLVRKIESGAGFKGWIVQLFSTNGIRGVYSLGGGACATPIYTLTVGQSVRVSVVMTAAFIAMYINGEFFASTAGTGGVAVPSGEPLTIACLSPYFASAVPTEFAPVTMSDVRLWNVERTAAQIKDNAFKRLSGTETGLVSYWKLDEGTGTTATDTKGVQNGTLTSTSTATLPQWVDDPSWPNNNVARDPQLMMQWSKDGGHTWGNEVWQSLGTAGGYLTRAVFRNLGRSRDWLFRLRVTDRVKVVIIGAAALFGP